MENALVTKVYLRNQEIAPLCLPMHTRKLSTTANNAAAHCSCKLSSTSADADHAYAHRTLSPADCCCSYCKPTL